MSQIPPLPGYDWSAPPPDGSSPSQPVKTSGMAIASLICSLLGLLTCCAMVLSVVGIVLGGVALSNIRRGIVVGRGLAMSGLILGIAGVLIGVVVWIVLANSPPGTPEVGALVSDSDRARLESMGVLNAGEEIDLLYASGLFSVDEGGAVLTDQRLVVYQGQGDIEACPLADIRAIEFIPGKAMFDEGSFLVESDGDQLLIFTIGSMEGGDELFHQLLRRATDNARKEAGKPPAASELSGSASTQRWPGSGSRSCTPIGLRLATATAG